MTQPLSHAVQIPIPWEYLQRNLVTQIQIASRMRVDRSCLSRWKKYDDWPAPVLTWPWWSNSGIFELFWWPDVKAFCDRHDVEPGRGMRRGRRRKDPS